MPTWTPATMVLSVAASLVTVLTALAGCEHAQPRAPARVITIDQLPPGAAHRADGPPLLLKVSYDAAGTPTGFTEGAQDGADIAIKFIGPTMAQIANYTTQRFKVDLWISRDGARFVYTSSCPLPPGGSSFEDWPGRVRWLYMSNPRVQPLTAPAVCE